MAKLITIYWRDIPSQVIAKAGRKTAKVMLGERFQVAIDRAAELKELADSAAAELENQFDDAALEALTKAQGLLDPPE